jgi:hypothetical protein
MKYFIILLSLIVSFGQAHCFENERILSFHSKIEIQKDRSVIVTEEITVWSQGIEIKRGVYRDVPLNFKLPDGTIRQSLKILNLERNGKPEKYKTEMITGGIRIYAGSSDVNLTRGQHTYALTYSLDRTVFCREDNCEVMWNVNGNHWAFSIDTLSAVITTPENTTILSYDGWTGSYGESNKKDFITKSVDTGKQVFMTRNLSPSNNLTISVVFSKDAVSEILFSTKASHFFRDNAIVILAILAFILTFLINFILWLKFGVDPKKGTIIPQFYPPKDWSPAEVLFLLNEGKEDKNMFASQLLQLAVKGHIKIEKKDSKSKHDTFIISPTEVSTKKEKLTEIEKGFLHLLLGDKPFIAISNKYNSRVALANNFLISRIEKKQKKVYYRKNKRLLLPQYVVPFVSTIGMAVANSYYGGPAWLIFVTLILLILMNVIFMRLFYLPQRKGARCLIIF